jgi:hypothetical protein
MDHQRVKWIALASFVCQCQTDAFVFKRLKGVLQDAGYTSCPDSLASKRDAQGHIVKAMVSLSDATQQDRLGIKLKEKRHRAKRCKRDGIRKIFESVVLRITSKHLKRWGRLLEEWFDELADFPGQKHTKHLNLSGDKRVGKSSAYPLAVHLCLYGYAPAYGKHCNGNLQEVLAKVTIDPAWFDDCVNTCADRWGETFCNYTYVSKV